jgi:tetratricopeptide (TPR) repeat protein
MRLGSALWLFWAASGRLIEGRDLLEKALNLPGEESTQMRAKAWLRLGNLDLDLARFQLARAAFERSLITARANGDATNTARALMGLGIALWVQGDYGQARQTHEAALQIWIEFDDPRGVSAAWENIGNVAFGEGRLESARTAFETSLHLREAISDVSGIAWVQNSLGLVDRLDGRNGQARARQEGALEAMRQVGNRLGEGCVLHELGRLALADGDIDTARSRVRTALRLLNDSGSVLDSAECVESVALIAWANQRFEEGLILCAAVGTWREAHGAHPARPMKAFVEQEIGRVRRNINAQTFEHAWAAGQTLSLFEAVTAALMLDS